MIQLMEQKWFSFAFVFVLGFLAVLALELLPEGFFRGIAIGSIIGIGYGVGYGEGRLKEMNRCFEDAMRREAALHAKLVSYGYARPGSIREVSYPKQKGGGNDPLP